MSFRDKSVKTIKNALKIYRDSPYNHGMTELEVNELLEIESEFDRVNNLWDEQINQTTLAIKEAFDFISILSTTHYKISLNGLKYLVKNGWYISDHIFENCSFKDLYFYTREGNVSKFEEFVIKTFDSKFEKIMKTLHESFPERIQLFNEIEQLYKLTFYNSLINLCYSQVDGICNKVWGLGFFDVDKKNNYNLKLPNNLNFKGDSVNSIISSQLSEPKNEITKHSKDFSFTDEEKIKSFNRHFVIHGHSINYGSKKNAIRAILLLEFVTWLANESKST